ncbi:MAG: prolyl oligopeptidase family serine peptidase [Actinomycetales bacterium]|nr:prolyl oligopeptidase family serine peptidase [Actinomycetales bacterium]
MPTYPDAPRLDLVDDYDGVLVPDPYRWLEDPADERTVSWAAEQAALLEAERASWTTVDHFRDRITTLVSAGSIGAPTFRRDRRFFMRRTGDQQFAVLCTVDPDGTERVLLDPIALDPSGLTTLDTWQPSKEGDLLAYQLSQGGTEESVLRVMDVATGETVDGPIDRARYSPVAWIPGGAAYYYVRRLDPAGLPEGEEQFHRRVFLHRLGTDPAEDVEIFGAGRPVTSYFGVSVSMDGRWLLVSSSEGTEPRNDLWIADLEASSHEAPALVDVQVDVDANTSMHIGRDGRAYVHTDLDAPRGRVLVTDPTTPTAEHWVELVPEDAEAVLEDFAILDGDELERPVLAVAWTRHTVGEVTLHDLGTGERTGEVPLPGVGTLGGLVERPDGGPMLWFVYTDFTTQIHVYSYDGRTGEVALFSSPPGSVDVPDVVSQQVTYTSADGTLVRMFLLSHAHEPDRPRPTFLYGYGGFGIPMTPGFSATALAWVEAGGVYAVACIRGGGEEGEDWHRAGMLGTKQNVFDDFHAAAEWLEREGWTTRDQLAIHGGSNGGLLVGAALTQRPELYGTVVCTAPLLDMVRYVHSQLGRTWTVEYGDPQVPEELAWLLAYSPYHHVVEGTDYPATLFMVFDNDTRTDPMHGRKMCAAMQHATSGTRPVLIRSGAEVGHGARSLNRAIDEQADMLAFIARWTGLELP